MHDLLPVLPTALSLACAVGMLLAQGGFRRLVLLAALGQGALLAAAVLLALSTGEGRVLVHALGGWPAPVGIVFVGDRLSALFGLLTVCVAAAALIASFLEEEPGHRGRVLALVFLLQAGMLGAIFTGDLFDFYVFFELMGVASYGLVAYRGERAHVEAGFKYAALSLTGSLLMFVGVASVYAQTGVLAFASLYEASYGLQAPPLYLLSLALILTSLSLKAALIPLHFWLPDAHSIAPTAVSVLLSGAVVKVGAYGLLRLLGSHAPWIWETIGTVLLPLAATTALLAAWAAAAQQDLKRLLAYSTISQMGYILAALALGTVAGVSAALVFAIAHAAMKSTLFVLAGIAIDASGERRWDRMGGLLHRSPLFASTFLVTALSLAGIPPMVGFAGKLAVFGAFVETESWWTLVALLGASLSILVVLVRVWLKLFGGEAKTKRGMKGSKLALSALMAAVILGLGLGAGPLLRSTDEAAKNFMDGDAYRAAVLGGAGP